jgi:hypothetical protein
MKIGKDDKSMSGSDRAKSPEEIMREMDEMLEKLGASPSVTPSQASPDQTPKKGGALKSVLNFFVKIEPEEGEEIPAEVAESLSIPSGSTPANTGNVTRGDTQKRPKVADLVAGEEQPTFTAPESTTEDLSNKSFEEIYQEAGIAQTECSVDELTKLLENPAVANQPLSVKIVAVNLALSAKGIGADVPIADAVRRDRALDAYQEMLAERAQNIEKSNSVKIEEITKETEEYLKRKQAEIEALRTEISEANRQSVDFSIRREVEEKRMFELISPFLEGKPNPVSVGKNRIEN